MVITVFLLTLPGKAFPTRSWFDDLWIDKWVHIAMFAITVFIWAWAFSKYNPALANPRTFLLLAIVSLIYGIGMEFVQKYLVINRSFDMGDIIADAVGSAAGLFYSSKRFIKK